jgi:hypothetical protein
VCVSRSVFKVPKLTLTDETGRNTRLTQHKGVPVHTVKVHGEIILYLYSLLNLELDGECPSLPPDHFNASVH